MIEFYPQIKAVHVISVLLSGSLFTMRGLLMLMRSRKVNVPALRYLSYTIDTILLISALVLVAILHAWPFQQPWLTVKVVLLLVYIVLGTLALKRARSRGVQVWCYLAALCVFAFMVSVARSHNPLGLFAALLS